MHTFYLDKNNIFECQIEIEGADINKSKSRLLLENEDGSILLFNGTLDNQGNCNIKLDNIKSYLKENNKGKISLEVIVEDTIFTPYESNFNIDVAKKVTVSEVKKNDIIENTQPKITVKVKEKNPFEQYINEFKEINNKAKLSSKYNFDKILELYLKKKFINKPQELIKEVKENLQKIK
jgi:hypothetical protein